MSTQTKALLLVAMLSFARAERITQEVIMNEKLQHILQAHPDERPGVALDEEQAEVDGSISELSRTCNQAALQQHVVHATSLLQKGQGFNWLNLADLMKDLFFVTQLIQWKGCKIQDLQDGQWQNLKAALQSLAPPGLPAGEIKFDGVVADTFSLTMFGKLWKDKFPSQGMPSITSDAMSPTTEQVNAAMTKTDSDLAPWKQVDPFDRLSLLESGSNASQLVSNKWHPLAFVGGIIIGPIALVVAIICALLNVVETVALAVLNAVFGSIYCLIKTVVQMREPNAQGFLPCMSTNAIAQVLKFAWRCNMACGVWGLKISSEAFKLAFDIKSNDRGKLEQTPPSCFKA